jgi:hypothetical protein
MQEIELPEPAAFPGYSRADGWYITWNISFAEFDGPDELFTADQLTAYARAAVFKERERAAKVCESGDGGGGGRGWNQAMAWCAAAIRKG